MYPKRLEVNQKSFIIFFARMHSNAKSMQMNLLKIVDMSQVRSNYGGLKNSSIHQQRSKKKPKPSQLTYFG